MESRQSHVKKKIRPQQGKAHIWKYKDTHRKEYTFCCHYCLVAQPCLTATPWIAARQASLSLSISWSLPKFMPIALVMPSSHLILWHSLLLLPSIFPSIRDFSNESSVCIRWPKYWSFRISPSDEYSGLISLKIDWFDRHAVQWALRSLLQQHSWKV